MPKKSKLPLKAKPKKQAVVASFKDEDNKAGRKGGEYSFAKNPNSEFRGKKTAMKRPSGRKR
jgi:hypothetical protein